MGGADVTGLEYEDLVTAATVGLARRPLQISGLAGPAGERALVLGYGELAEHAAEELVLLMKAAVEAAAGERPYS